MKQLIASREDVLSERHVSGLISDSRDVWPVCGAGIGLVGGMLAPVLGAFLTVVAWFEGDSRFSPLLHKLGTASFLLTIPLLIFGGYCLDVLEKRGWKLRGLLTVWTDIEKDEPQRSKIAGYEDDDK